MNVKQYLDHCTEQNWQVIEQEKKTLNADKAGENDPEAGGRLAGEKAALEARVQSLKHSILILKSELLEEKSLWKKEVELMASLIASGERSLEPELNSEAEADAKSAASVPVSPAESLGPSPLIRDFEERLSRYQGALAQAHADKRLHIRRQIAANTYRKRLNEVEKLCQEELNKVRETATHLEPLKQMASEWSRPRPNHPEPSKTAAAAAAAAAAEKQRKNSSGSSVECGGDYLSGRAREPSVQEESAYAYEVPVKQIDASLVMDEDASSEIKGKIVLQIGSLPSEVPTICYSAKFE